MHVYTLHVCVFVYLNIWDIFEHHPSTQLGKSERNIQLNTYKKQLFYCLKD